MGNIYLFTGQFWSKNISLHLKTIVTLLSHFEEAFLKQVQSVPRSHTNYKLNELLSAKRFQKHNNKYICSHIFAKQSTSLMWDGGAIKKSDVTWDEVRQPGNGPPSLPPCAHSEGRLLATNSKGVSGSEVLTSCHLAFSAPATVKPGKTTLLQSNVGESCPAAMPQDPPTLSDSTPSASAGQSFFQGLPVAQCVPVYAS